MNCGKCKWFKARTKEFRNNPGNCRRYAPKSFQIADTNSEGHQEARVWDGWPDVNENDFCGEFAASGSGNAA